MSNLTILILVAVGMACILGGITLVTHLYNLNGIKAKTVGNGQHGTARWATKREIRRTYRFFSLHRRSGVRRLQTVTVRQTRMGSLSRKASWSAAPATRLR